MPVSIIYCTKCGADSHFFSSLDGKQLRGTCGHIIHNRPERKRDPSIWDQINAKARKKLHVRKAK